MAFHSRKTAYLGFIVIVCLLAGCNVLLPVPTVTPTAIPTDTPTPIPPPATPSPTPTPVPTA
ncbi:MAG TPA: hypothetical protein PKG95_09535, partial [Anaerolineaceae bacterium]|nr:hypothetical protein [Anaerolineaceae bacterium]